MSASATQASHNKTTHVSKCRSARLLGNPVWKKHGASLMFSHKGFEMTVRVWQW